MKIGDLDFRTIDLEKHGDLCIRFREDAYICSFGSAERFYEADGKGAERYLEENKKRIQDQPESCVHIWKDNQIIGQIELERWFKDATIGYIDLMYLIPEYRGKGIARLLEEYAALYFKKIGCKRARLSVSPANVQALRFYLKNGWKDLGPRENLPEVHYMEKCYED
jgi:GNAT superfamily N-acetyltransferase